MDRYNCPFEILISLYQISLQNIPEYNSPPFVAESLLLAPQFVSIDEVFSCILCYNENVVYIYICFTSAVTMTYFTVCASVLGLQQQIIIKV